MPTLPTILVVEPRQNVRTFVEMTLSQEGMCVFSAVSLDSALLQLRVLHPDLIVVSCSHPEADAVTAVAELKALCAAPLLLLGNRNSDGKSEAGFADVLSHPYQAGELCSKVARLLNSADMKSLNG